MKIINYLYNVLRLGVMRVRKNYDGSILQGIPCSTAIFSSGGGYCLLKENFHPDQTLFLRCAVEDYP